MVAGPSVRKKTCWLEEEPFSMDSSSRKNEATPSRSVCVWRVCDVCEGECVMCVKVSV